MNRLFLAFCLAIAGSVQAQPGYGDLNYNGYLTDTSQIGAFKKDSLKYSKVFNLSQYENSRFRVCFDDTSNTGFSGDSVKFFYFAQVGSPCLNSSGKLDTAWNNNPLIIDTVDMLTAANMATSYSALATDGTFTEDMGQIDTSNVTGYATNSHAVTMPWDVYCRIGVKGLTGNKIGRFVKLRVDRLARNYVKTKTQ